MKRLPDAELEVMLIVWGMEPPVMAAEILQRLKERRNWSIQTLITVLSRLVEKGFLACEKVGRSNLYHAVVTEEAYKRAEGKGLLERLYGNSLTSLVANLVDAKAVEREDLDELRGYLDELEGRR